MPFTQHKGSLSAEAYGQFRFDDSFILTQSGTNENYNLRTAALNAGWNQSSPIRFICTGTIGSASVGSESLTITGSFPGGLLIKNNGFIIGFRGYANDGYTGGLAIYIYSYTGGALLLDNGNGTIAGGGGGGGGGASAGAGGGYHPSSGYSLSGSNAQYGANCDGTIGAGGAAGSNGGNGGYGGGGGVGAYGGQAANCYGDSDPYDPGGIRFGGYSGGVGSPGAAINGYGLITSVISLGTYYGALNT